MKLRLFYLLALLGIAIICDVRADEVIRLSDIFQRQSYAAISLRRTAENHLYQVGRLNGKRGSCLVDTAWSFTTAQPNSVLTSNMTAMLTLGDVNFTNVPMRVEKVMFNGQRAAFDVVLGLDFLRNNFALLDCGAGRLYTRTSAIAPEAQAELEAALRKAGYCAIDLKLKSPPSLTFVARVNDEPTELLLDSGAVWSCLDHRQLPRLKLNAKPSAARITGAGKTGIRSVSVVGVKSLQLGEITLKDSTLAVFDLSDWGFAAPGKTLGEVQGILGGELLRETSAVIDCRGLKLWVKPRGKKDR